MFVRTIRRGVLACALAGIAACATGGSSGSGNGNGDPVDAPVAHHDAESVLSDAPVAHADANMPDAFVPQDAPPSGDAGLFCSQNSQCTTAGECCVTLGGPTGFCAPGTVVLGQCVPQ